MSAAAVKPHTDEKYAEILHDISAKYKKYIKRGISYLAEAKEANDAIKHLFAPTVNHDHLNEITENTIDEISRNTNFLVTPADCGRY